MGCWNKTCGLSNLHITAGTDVYVFVLEKNDHHDRCYSTAFYQPLLLPFYSKYDDYGGGEDSSGVGLPFIMEGLKQKLVEMDVGENQYHDIAVKRDGFNDATFFEAVHEDRLRVKGYGNEQTEVDFVMFRKDIVDSILDTWIREKYVGSDAGTTGWDNAYITYTFKDVLADVPEFLDTLERFLKGETTSDKWASLEGIPPRLNLSMSGGLGELFEWTHPNKASWYIFRDQYRYSSIVRVHDLIIEAMDKGDRATAEALLVDHLKATYIDCFMHEVRKVWLPGAHEGSQSQEHSGYLALINAMNATLTKEWIEHQDN